jgi:hypothetical protein
LRGTCGIRWLISLNVGDKGEDVLDAVFVSATVLEVGRRE